MYLARVTVAVLAVLTAVSADRSVVVLYNNGIDDPDAGYCSDEEQDMTHAILVESSQNYTYGFERYLGSNDEEEIDEYDMTQSMRLAELQQGDRNLAFYPAKCKNLCAGAADNHCQAVDCKGYRRRRRQLSKGQNDDRSLLSGSAFTCTQQVTYINTELDRLVDDNLVSESCKTLLMNPRRISCFDDVIYGVIESYRLRDNNDWSEMEVTGQPICVNNVIDLVFDLNLCVDLLQIDIEGPTNYNTLWNGDLPLNYFMYYPGSYQVTATPDGHPEKAKKFNVNLVTGDVLGVALYDTRNKVYLNNNFVSGNTVCTGRPMTWKFDLDSCALMVRATLTGPAGFVPLETYQWAAPFTMYGLSRYGNMIGRSLTIAGTYTLTLYPDEIESNKVKTIQFSAVKCY